MPSWSNPNKSSDPTYSHPNKAVGTDYWELNELTDTLSAYTMAMQDMKDTTAISWDQPSKS